MIKKVLLTTALIATSATAGAKTVNILMDESYKPYTFMDKGKPAGAYVEILKEADKAMPNFELTFEGAPWKRALASVESGSALALLPPYNSRETMDYSETIYEEQVVTSCNKKEVASKPEGYPVGYRGLVVGNNLGFGSPGEAFFKEVEAGNIKLEEARKTEVNLKKVLGGRIDCYINDRIVISDALKALGKKSAKLKASFDDLVEYHVVSSSSTHVGIAKKGDFPHKDAFMAELNKAIKMLKENGTIDKIISKYK